MSIFVSDNVSVACPQVMEAVQKANAGVVPSYGKDTWTSNLQSTLSDIFEKDVVVFPAVTGTACNALALASITPPFGAIYCHELAHINTDECGAPEHFSGGAKLIPIPGQNGKLTADALAKAIFGAGNIHHAQPAALSITQSCEAGTIYSLEEIQALSSVARKHKLKVHMDGARFANALSALGASPAEMTWKAGVDVLSFGGTKNGCLMAEAVVFFNPEDARAMPFLHKRAGQLVSKMRFISAQLIAYVNDDLWLKNARHANAMAALLSEGMRAVDGVKLAYPTQANEVFARLPEPVVKALEAAGFEINNDELDKTAERFVCAWDTRKEDVEKLLSIIQEASAS